MPGKALYNNINNFFRLLLHKTMSELAVWMALKGKG